MDNLHRVTNIFISDGTGLPANNSAITSVSAGDIGVYGTDMTALNPAGGDTITTQPSIFIVEGKTDSGGNSYVKRSARIDGMNVINYSAASYTPSKRQVECIGYDRSLSTGSIEVNDNTNYNFFIRFKNDKNLYSARPEVLNVNFTSANPATQSSIADQIVSAINASSFRSEVIAVKVGDGTGAYGLTSATNYGVEVTGKDIEQFYTTSYTPNIVYFSLHVNDGSGFGTTTTQTTIQKFTSGTGTYSQVYTMENENFGYEGTYNRRQWPIPALDYSSSSTYLLSSAIAETANVTTGQDKVTFSATVAAKIRSGEKIEIDGVNYEIKYFISTTVAILTSALTTTNATAAVKVRLKYDLVNIEFNDKINTPTGVVAVANKSVVIAVPAIDSGGAYNSLSTAGTNLKAILDAWMTTTPGAFANISI